MLFIFPLILCHVMFCFVSPHTLFHVVYFSTHFISCFILFATVRTGLARSTIANGCSMVAYKKVQQFLIDSRVQ